MQILSRKKQTTMYTDTTTWAPQAQQLPFFQFKRNQSAPVLHISPHISTYTVFVLSRAQFKARFNCKSTT